MHTYHHAHIGNLAFFIFIDDCFMYTDLVALARMQSAGGKEARTLFGGSGCTMTSLWHRGDDHPCASAAQPRAVRDPS